MFERPRRWSSPLRSFSALALFAMLALMTPGGTAAQLRLGNEFQVTELTFGNLQPAVAIAPSGDFVVVWTNDSLDGSELGVFARRFSATGNALGGDFRVNTYTLDTQQSPAIAMDAAGNFVVAWESMGQDGYGYGIFARRFSSDGQVLSSEFRVNHFIEYSQSSPTVETGPLSGFVVVWQTHDGSGEGVFARRFASSGAAVGTEFLVNEIVTGDQRDAAIAAVPSGDFLVVWKSAQYDSSVFARRLSSAGALVGGEFLVNSFFGLSEQPSVAGGSSGEFLVAWQEGGTGKGVLARRVSTTGALLGSELLIDTFTALVVDGRDTSVAAGENGEFIVSWTAYELFGGDVFARRFSSAGVALASEFQVNSYTPFRQEESAVAASASGVFVVTWRSSDGFGNSSRVLAQRFAPQKVLDIDGNGFVTPLTDGVLVLRFLFGFTGTPLTAGAVDTDGCTRCNADKIVPYLQTLI